MKHFFAPFGVQVSITDASSVQQSVHARRIKLSRRWTVSQSYARMRIALRSWGPRACMGLPRSLRPCVEVARRFCPLLAANASSARRHVWKVRACLFLPFSAFAKNKHKDRMRRAQLSFRVTIVAARAWGIAWGRGAAPAPVRSHARTREDAKRATVARVRLLSLCACVTSRVSAVPQQTNQPNETNQQKTAKRRRFAVLVLTGFSGFGASFHWLRLAIQA